MKNIAILGATGHIAKSLIYNFNKSDKYNLYLFARSAEKLYSFLKIINYDKKIEKTDPDNFVDKKYDAVINCIGIGDPGKLENIGSEIFEVTEHYDNLILDYLNYNNDCIYINFSSGAVYGRDFSIPASELKCCEININQICNKDNYGIVKIYSEAKHRSYKKLNIIDLRVFSFFSRFIDLNAKYLITEIISCVKKGIEFKTGNNNVVRDFIHPNDLFNLVCLCINLKEINDVFDVYSLKPVTKFEIIDYFHREYNLKYKVECDVLGVNVTGIKDNYYSISKKANKIGYIPKFSSLDCIINEAKEILKNVC